MILSKTLLVAATATAVVAFHTPSQAGDGVKLKPLHGSSFEAGDAHAVGYFEAERGACKIVLTYSIGDQSGNQDGFTVTHHEVRVGPKDRTHYSISGQPYEFACNGNAEAMTFKSLSRYTEAQ